MKKLIGFIVMILLYTSYSYAGLEITCSFPEKGKSLIINHPLNPSNIDANQAPSDFQIKSDQGNTLAQGSFTKSLFFFDPNLTDTLIFMFTLNEYKSPVLIALDRFQTTSLEDWVTGTYSAWSEMNFNYNGNVDDTLVAKAQPCTVKYSE